ncbi:MAG: YigZ family protein [Enterobacterales bacterium]|nr:YigZ family protein [Enterobacterales bacterium]
MPSYKVPSSDLEIQEVIKNSHFITRIYNKDSAEAAKAQIKQLRQQYPDATHHCWAYIVGKPQSTTLIGCSDDGEPSGTAGKPMLQVLQHSDVGDILAVCTRYFGGTKLGTGGLARAYGGGVKLALEQLSLKIKISYLPLSFELDYTQLQDCQHLIKDYQIQNLTIDYQSEIIIHLEISEKQKTGFVAALTNLTKGQVVYLDPRNDGLLKYIP